MIKLQDEVRAVHLECAEEAAHKFVQASDDLAKGEYIFCFFGVLERLCFYIDGCPCRFHRACSVRVE